MTTPCAQEDRITRIEKSVGDINTAISGISSDIAVVKTRMSDVLDRVEDHEHVLRGYNGYSGIIAKIESSNQKIDKMDTAMFEDGGTVDTLKQLNNYMKTSQDKEKERTTEKKDNFKWLWRLVVGSAVTAILGWIYVLINLK